MSAVSGGMAAMVVLYTAANVVNYSSSFVFSRILEPVGFGELTSLLALSLVLAVPTGAAQTVVAERVAVANAAGDLDRVRYLIRLGLGHVAAIAAVVGLVYVACIPLVIEVLGIRQPGPAIALAPLVVLTFIGPITVGVLQGLERFAALGFVIFGIAVSRLAFGVPWALGGGGAGGAIAGQALGIFVVTACVGIYYRNLLIGRGTGAATRGIRRRIDLHGLSASGAFVAFALISNLDLILARVYLDGEQAGIYAALSTVAKVVIFLPTAVAMIMVPSAARAHAATGTSARVLRMSAALVAASGLLVALPSAIAPGLIVELMFGPDYDAATSGVLPATLAGAGLAMLNLLCIYSVAIRDRRWMFLLVGGVGLQVAAISLFHGSPTQIAWAQAVIALAVLVANELLFHALLPLRRKRT
jgi:O-antigen/teichoic acid export membrane protein